jgi:hypothetical protein
MTKWIEMHDDVPSGCLVVIAVGLLKLTAIGVLIGLLT